MGLVFDINGSEFLVIAVIAVILVGPERLPEYVRGLRTLVKRLRGALREGETALRAEFGDDVDWKSLDPRQYDPRSIVRDALFEDESNPAPVATGSVGAAGIAAMGSWRDRKSTPNETASDVPAVPFDDEAT